MLLPFRGERSRIFRPIHRQFLEPEINGIVMSPLRGNVDEVL